MDAQGDTRRSRGGGPEGCGAAPPRSKRLRDRLHAAWRRSDEILQIVPENALLDRPIPLRQPFVFYLGHLPAFSWNKVCRGVLGMPGFAPEFDSLFERGIDPVDLEDYRPATKTDWPPVGDVLRYRDRIRAVLDAAYADVEVRPAAERAVYEMALEHELMHQETVLYMAQQLPRSRRVSPANPAPPRLRGAASPGCVSIPRGTATLGAACGSLTYGWDNEFEEHAVEVPPFVIDQTPVRNGEYLEFVQAGAYGRRELWSEEAWGWLQTRGIDHPPFWLRQDGHWAYHAFLHELPIEDVLDWPAYATWAEARAFLAWRGQRLPTEAEFHRAAYGSSTQNGGPPRAHAWGDDSPTAAHGNFGFAQWGPTPVGVYAAGASGWGVHDLIGNGWEWTGTPFEPFPGFRPHPAYPEYSQDFFDGRHHVLLGASWATDVTLIRRSFRNWFQPHYPYVFAKFRGVSPG